MDYKESTWNGYKRLDFIFEGREAILVFPKTPCAEKKWMLKTEYFGAYPDFELRMIGEEGYHLAYIQNKTRWHVPEDDTAKADFADFLTKEWGLDEKCLPVGMSCGGMQAVYFAATHPDKVWGLFLDAPVLNLLSCPCGVANGTSEMYLEMVNHTGFTTSKLINYRNHPIDNVHILIENKIPVFLSSGDSDNIVPFCENGEVLAEMYKKTDIPFRLVIKPDCWHHPHGLTDNTPVIEFFKEVYYK